MVKTYRATKTLFFSWSPAINTYWWRWYSAWGLHIDNPYGQTVSGRREPVGEGNVLTNECM